MSTSLRSAALRIASGLPKGDATRRRLLALLKEAKFPPKAVDVNKVPDAEGFWKWPVSEALRYSGMRFNPNEIGDVIFFLNMAADAWERVPANKKRATQG